MNLLILGYMDAENELIKHMKTIVEFYENSDYVNEEITMWRSRFLENLPKYNNKEKAEKLFLTILYTPSKAFMEKSPEEHIKEIEELLGLNEN